MLVAYLSGHGFGHATRTLEVLRAVRARRPELPIAVASALPEWLLARAGLEPVRLRRVECDVGLVQHDALRIDEAATALRCRAFEEGFEARVDEEAAFLARAKARLVLGDVPPLAFAAASRAGVPALALANFSWDAIYRHLAPRQPALMASAELAARAYASAELLLELPFACEMPAFARRRPVGLVARRPRVPRAEARRRLGLDGRTSVLLSFGGIGLPGLSQAEFGGEKDLRYLFPGELGEERLARLGLEYPDVVGAVEVVVTKPGYGIVTDAVGAGTRLLYTDRGDFPEYPVMVREMPRYLPCLHVTHAEVAQGRLARAVERVLALPWPEAPDLAGAERAAELLLARL